MAHPHHIPDYASPRSSLQSPGLTHRGKTPRSGGFGDEAQHAHFQFNEFGLDVSASGGGVGEGTCARSINGSDGIDGAID